VVKGRNSGNAAHEQWETFFQADAILEALDVTVLSAMSPSSDCATVIHDLRRPAASPASSMRVDIDPLMVNATDTRASRAGLRNIVVEQRDLCRTVAPTR